MGLIHGAYHGTTKSVFMIHVLDVVLNVLYMLSLVIDLRALIA